nr:hypothetical protein [Tanacetum cinerariifolium]
MCTVLHLSIKVLRIKEAKYVALLKEFKLSLKKGELDPVSGTNGEDAVEHIEYFVKNFNIIKLSNVNYKPIRLAIFLISLVGNAREQFDESKCLITSWVDLTEMFFGRYYPPFCTSWITMTKAIRDSSKSTIEKWLASKFTIHMIMDPFSKKVFWDLRIKGNDQEGVVDEEFSDIEEANNDDEQETAEIIRIETNLFDYETPLYTKFKEFNFLLKVDPELFTHDIERTKTYKDYEIDLNDELEETWSKDGVPYEICDHICEPFCFKNRKAKWPTCNSNEDEFCNRGELPRMVRVGYMTYFQDYESYNELVDGNLKEEALKQKAIYEKLWDTTHNAPVCKIRIFEMIKYSFGQDEEYVAIKECEYYDLAKTNKDACQEYQEIFHSMDEGWMVFLYGASWFLDTATSTEKKLTKLVKYQSSGILCVL